MTPPGYDGGVQTIRRDAPAALATGAAVGVVGGLIGLGGAEFRLPLLVGVFRYGLRPAVRLNLLMSLVTVTAAAITRLAWGQIHQVVEQFGVAVPLMVGGMVGAYLASSWLAGVTEAQLRKMIQALLLFIGLLLMAEALLPWKSAGLPLDFAGRVLVGVLAGLLIGVVSSLLGVAGGELIIRHGLLLVSCGVRGGLVVKDFLHVYLAGLEEEGCHDGRSWRHGGRGATGKSCRVRAHGRDP